MDKPKRVIALISDTHVGSKYALWPPEFTCEEGNVLKANKGQQQIYDYWVDFNRQCDACKVDTVLHLGDALHGTNRKQFGQNLMTSELDIQMDAAEQLLRMIKKDREFLIISGSGYHESLDVKIHKQLARRLDGKFCGAMCNWSITGTNRKMNFAHGGSGAVIYRSTVIDRELNQMLQAQALDKLPKVDIVARGHWHTFIHLHLAKQHGVQVPCWAAWMPDKPYLRSYGKMQPDIGGVIMFIDSKDRITVWHFLYPAVHIADRVMYL